MRLAELRPASTVMIVGGAGSVAHYAIQFAKMRGARVITTVSGPEKATHARKAGADEMINYRTENLGQRVKALTDGHGVDAMIELDLSTNGKDYPNILRPHATVVVYGMSSNESTLPALWLMRNSITLRLFSGVRPQCCRPRDLPCRAWNAPPKQPADPYSGTTLAVERHCLGT